MITLGSSLQNTDEIPTEIAAWIVERDHLFPDVNFIVEKYEIRDVDKPAEENGHRAIREKFVKVFYPRFKITDLKKFGVLQVSYLFGQETWTVRIVGGITKEGKVRHSLNIKEGEEIIGLTPEMRDQIAGFRPEDYELQEHVSIQGDQKEHHFFYGERRTEKTPLIEYPLEKVSVEWDFRKTAVLSMSGKEFKEACKDPEKLTAMQELVNLRKKGEQLH